MTSNEFYCRALLEVAGNSQFAIDFQNYKVGLSEWGRGVERAAAVLTEIAQESNPFDDEPDKPP